MSKRRAPLSVRIPDDLYPLMDQQADRLGLSRNQFVVMAIKAAVRALPNLPSPDQAVSTLTPVTLKPVDEAEDVWSQDSPTRLHQAVEKRHWHSYVNVDEESVEYRGGDKYAYLACECGKLSPAKEKVRPNKEKR